MVQNPLCVSLSASLLFLHLLLENVLYLHHQLLTLVFVEIAMRTYPDIVWDVFIAVFVVVNNLNDLFSDEVHLLTGFALRVEHVALVQNYQELFLILLEHSPDGIAPKVTVNRIQTHHNQVSHVKQSLEKELQVFVLVNLLNGWRVYHLQCFNRLILVAA